MKKIFTFGITLIMGLFIFTSNVGALSLFNLNITLTSGTTTNYLNSIGANVSSSYSNNEITYKYTYSNTDYILTFTEEDGILKYESIIGDSEAEYQVSELLITEILCIILESQNYTDEEIIEITSYMENKNITPYDMTTNGIFFEKENVGSNYYITSLEVNLNESSFEDPEVSITYVSSTSNTVVLSTNLDNVSYETCEIYRKTDDSDYELIDEITCTDSLIYTDNTVSSNTTYYYDMVLKGESVSNDYVAVTTDSGVEETIDSTVDTDEEDTSGNPQTGYYIPISILCLLILSAVYIKVYVKNKNKITNI